MTNQKKLNDMENMLSVAKMFNALYKTENGVNMDQMRMHKMMYLVQRESLMYNKIPLFNAQFEGWMYGPILIDVRNEYNTGDMFQNVPDSLDDATRQLINSVYRRYNKLSLWKLSSLCHSEISWKHSRECLKADSPYLVPLKLADMRLDAARELFRRKRRI